MADDEFDTDLANVMNLVVQKWAAEIVRVLGRDGEDADMTQLRMMALSEKIKRGELSIDLLHSIAPDAADPQQWIRWIDGGTSPHHRLKMEKFDPNRANSGRKIKAALNDVTNRTERSSEARLRLEQAREEMLEAERALERTEQQEKLALDMAKGVIAWAYLNEVASVASSVFAMGPAWALMRVVSGHLQEDSEWEKGLQGDQRALLLKHRSTRQELSKEMLGILHNMSGDPAFEVNLFEHLYDWLKPYADEAAEGGTKSSRAHKLGLGRRAKTDDASSVTHSVFRDPS